MISETTSRNSSGQRAIVLCVIALMVLTTNLFVVQPLLAAKGHTLGAVFINLGLRVVTFVALAFFLVRWAGCNRFQTLSTIMLIGAATEVGLRFLSMKYALSQNPGMIEGGAPTDGIMLFAFAQGFLAFAPILLVLGFLGVELNKFQQDWKRKRVTS